MVIFLFRTLGLYPLDEDLSFDSHFFNFGSNSGKLSAQVLLVYELKVKYIKMH